MGAANKHVQVPQELPKEEREEAASRTTSRNLELRVNMEKCPEAQPHPPGRSMELPVNMQTCPEATPRPVLRRMQHVPSSSIYHEVECSHQCMLYLLRNTLVWPVCYLSFATLSVILFDVVNPLPTSVLPLPLFVMEFLVSKLGFHSRGALTIVLLFITFFVGTSIAMIPVRIAKFGEKAAYVGCGVASISYPFIFYAVLRLAGWTYGHEFRIAIVAFLVMGFCNNVAALMYEIIRHFDQGYPLPSCWHLIAKVLWHGTVSTWARVFMFATFLVSMKLTRIPAIASHWWSNTLVSSLLPKTLCLLFMWSFKSDAKSTNLSLDNDIGSLQLIVLQTMLLEGLSKYIAFQNTNLLQLTFTFMVQNLMELAAWAAMGYFSNKKGVKLADHVGAVSELITSGGLGTAATEATVIELSEDVGGLLKENSNKSAITPVSQLKVAACKSWLNLHKGWHSFAEYWVMVVVAYCSSLRDGDWHSRFLRMEGLAICAGLEFLTELILHVVWLSFNMKIVKPVIQRDDLGTWASGFLFGIILCCICSFDYYCWCHWDSLDWHKLFSLMHGKSS